MTTQSVTTLDWLSEILWPDSGARLVSSAAADGSGWLVKRAADGPRLLVPNQPKPALRASLRRYHDGLSSRQRLSRLLMEFAGPTLAPVTQETVGLSTPTSGLPERIAEEMGEPELHVAITLGPPRTNRKPVLQLIRPDGVVVGFAKIGWNDYSRSLVHNEHKWLEMVDGVRLGRLQAPRVLASFEDAGRLVLVTEAVAGTRRRHRPASITPALSDLRALAALDGLQRGAIGATAWARSIDDARRDDSRLDELAADNLQRVDHVLIGVFHGDLAPWNLFTISDELIFVIDWEFAAAEVPVGFDALHFHTQYGLELAGLNATRALTRSYRRSRSTVEALQPDAQFDVIWRLYLLELVRRGVIDNRLESDAPISGIADAAAALLRDHKPSGDRP